MVFKKKRDDSGWYRNALKAKWLSAKIHSNLKTTRQSMSNECPDEIQKFKVPQTKLQKLEFVPTITRFENVPTIKPTQQRSQKVQSPKDCGR